MKVTLNDANYPQNTMEISNSNMQKIVIKINTFSHAEITVNPYDLLKAVELFIKPKV